MPFDGDQFDAPLPGLDHPLFAPHDDVELVDAEINDRLEFSALYSAGDHDFVTGKQPTYVQNNANKLRRSVQMAGRAIQLFGTSRWEDNLQTCLLYTAPAALLNIGTKDFTILSVFQSDAGGDTNHGTQFLTSIGAAGGGVTNREMAGIGFNTYNTFDRALNAGVWDSSTGYSISAPAGTAVHKRTQVTLFTRCRGVMSLWAFGKRLASAANTASLAGTGSLCVGALKVVDGGSPWYGVTGYIHLTSWWSRGMVDAEAAERSMFPFAQYRPAPWMVGWRREAAIPLSPAGFANTNAFGAPTIAPGTVALSPAAHDDADAFGAATVAPGAVALAPAGVDDGDAFGAPIVSAGGATLAPPGVDDADAFGAPAIAPGAVALAPAAHDDADAFGAAAVAPGAVALVPPSLDDGDAFGAPAVTPGTATLSPAGFDDADGFGAPVVSGGLVTLVPPGLADGDAFGAPAVAPGAVVVAPAGYAHAGAFGSPAIALLFQLLTPAGLASTSVFGAPYVQLVDTDGLSIRALRSVLAEETDEVWLLLLTIDHESLAEPVRVAQNHQNVTSRGSLFVGYPFDLDLPGDAPGEQAHVTLRIDNIGVPDEDDPDKKRVSDYLRAIDSPFTATIEVVLASQPDIVEAGPFELECRQADYDAAEVSAELGFENLLDEPYPADSFVPATHPGLF